MKNKTIKQHQDFVKKASWEDITETLIELENQKFYIKSHLSVRQQKEIESLIEIYETKRIEQLSKFTDNSRFERVMNLEIQEESDIQFDLGDIEDDY